MKGKFLSVAFAALAAGALAIGTMAFTGIANAQDKKVTIGVSIPAADHGWTAGVVYHAERVAKLLMQEHPGLNVIVKTSPDAANQANALQDLAVQGLDGLVVLPTDPDPLVNAIKEIKDKGTFVALVDRAPSNNDNSIRDLYIAGNNPALGQVAGEYIAKNTPDAQVVVIRGMPIPIDQQRQDGFDKGIEGTNVKILDRQYGNWNRDDAFRVMQDFLTKYPKIDVVWCQDDDMAVGVLEAIKQANRDDIQYVIGGAGSKDMIKKVMDGDKLMPVDVLYPPAMVSTAMELAASHFYDQVPVSGEYILDATLITKDNAEEFYFPDSPF
ncbi:substrate-binding domain-containing protein [Brucella gallinifaecis]|uniref:Substrate-binding domain-containing protein n=1 Tax=Brucella gallinifaecis TaxID=215590 RepID=A0A502BRP6_9HYPH|nr:substrate-binding domain-containing protein [Brucella gallinifaecis]TPF76894.1 substrate-binding domain-containing protein [Brucella gallinifaecis]